MMNATRTRTTKQRVVYFYWCYWCLISLLVVDQCSIVVNANRHLIPISLRNSPVGIGIQSALSSKSNTNGKIDWAARSKSPTLVQRREEEEEEEEALLLTTRFVSSVQPLQNHKPSRTQWTDRFSRRSQRSSRSDLCLNDEMMDLSSPPPPSSLSPMYASTARGGGTAAAAAAASAAVVNVPPRRQLVFWESMVSGAISRSMAQTIMHPANTMKTMLQSSRAGTVGAPTIWTLMSPKMYKRLTRGAGANFILSVPHGAVNFAVLEFVRFRLNQFIQSVPGLEQRAEKMGPGLDFLSSAISTVCCSAVSTPQMMINDNIMAGNYQNLFEAVSGLYADRGILGFYRGWWPGLAGKIPSYALTWTLFQQLKQLRDRLTNDRPATNVENSIMGCVASGSTVCIMMPLDTIKTRLVTQISSKAASSVPYKGIVDCAIRMAQEEGIKAFYQGIVPRLVSVVPMIGIQFGVYEFMKNVMLNRDNLSTTTPTTDTRVKMTEKPTAKELSLAQRKLAGKEGSAEQALEIAAMEVAASPEQPFPAPHFLKKIVETKKQKKSLLQMKKKKIAK